MPKRTASALASVAQSQSTRSSPGLWPSDGVIFDRTCTDCPRLAAFLADAREDYPDYYCAPVAPFGDRKARLIVIGLAPGFHGANASGRPFTGDHAGLLLYRTLHRFGFASKPVSVSRQDDLKLIDCRITNCVRCVPPQNKPTPEEVRNCRPFLEAGLGALPNLKAVVALGQIAHQSAVKALGGKLPKCPFGHGARHRMPSGVLVFDSYHCSSYNQNTGRLTPEMFEAVFAEAMALKP